MKQTPVAIAAARAAARPTYDLASGQWYNGARVARKGSVLLQRWRNQSGPETVRARAKGASGSRRSYGGAAYGRTTADWIAQSTSADAELYTSLRTLRNRARQLVRDNEYAAHAMRRVIPNNVVGQGVRFQAQVMMRRGNRLDEKTNTAIEREWSRWTRAQFCHVAGKLSFQDIERMVMQETPESGEILVRMITRSFGGSRVPLGLEIIEADQLVDNWSGRTQEGREIRMGVEVDEWQRPVAYWLYPRHPGDYAIAANAPSNTWQRVPADEIIHVALFERTNQTRGVPWLASTLQKLRHIGGYEEAEIVRARASACIMGFIESPEIDTPLAADDPMGADDVMDGEKVFDMASGIVKELAPGEKFNGFAPSTPNAAMEGFMRFMLRSVAAGTGISYESLSRDYSQSNYSSSRLALTEDRDHYRVLQAWLIRTFHQRVFDKWLDLAVLSGALDLPAYETAPETYEAVRWSPRGWDWIDPLKEVTAAKLAVRSGFTTVDEVVAAKGGDVEETFKGLRRERDLSAEYDLVLDTDPAQTDMKGIVQGMDPVMETDTGLDADGNPLPGGGEGPDQADAATGDGSDGQQQDAASRVARLEQQQERLLLAAARLDERIDAARNRRR
jgi:lambda family phage portal protein